MVFHSFAHATAQQILVSVFCVSLILGSDLQGAKRTCSPGTKKLVTDIDQVKALLRQLTKIERMPGREGVENTKQNITGRAGLVTFP